jgi:ribosomal protein L13
MKVNKAGNVVDDNGKLFGRVVSGALAKLIGKKVDKEGKIWSESGKVIGTAELIPVDERDEITGKPFEDFPDAVINKEGHVIYEGQIVGKLVEGDAKKLIGKKIDPDGEVVDRVGNVLGKAERWDGPEEEAVPEPEKIDMSALAGKRVNKVGNVVDSHGEIYGRLVEGDPKKLAGKMCDKDGNVWSEGGNIVGRAELVPESERAGQKEGPFAGFDSPKVTKDGLVADSKGVTIGRLIQGDGKQLYGKEVDDDGDVLDKNGNTIGRAERWEPEEKQKAHNPVAGRKVNREGNVVDEDGKHRRAHPSESS